MFYAKCLTKVELSLCMRVLPMFQKQNHLKRSALSYSKRNHL